MIQITLTDLEQSDEKTLQNIVGFLNAIRNDLRPQNKPISIEEEGTPEKSPRAKETETPVKTFLNTFCGSAALQNKAISIAEKEMPEEIDEAPTFNDTDKAAGVDVTGIPWNAKIHSSSRAKTKNGEWRVKRNCRSSERATPAQQAIPIVQSAPITYQQTVKRAVQLLSRKLISPDELHDILQSHGLQQMADLQAHPDFAEEVLEDIEKLADVNVGEIKL